MKNPKPAPKAPTLNKPNKTTNPTNTTRRNILLGVGLLLSLILIAFAGVQIRTSNDAQRFEEADKVKASVAAQLSTYLGDNVVSTTEKKECFNTEQGPFDDGRLWCQTAIVVKLKEVTDVNQLAQQFAKMARSIGYDASLEGSNENVRAWFNAEGGIPCSLSIMSDDGNEIGASTRHPFESKDPAFAISCADRAQAKHYPFVE
jgi:hypothetical protein